MAEQFKKKKPLKEMFSFNKKQFENMIGFDGGEGQVCCCKEHVPHDESMKFILTASEENLKIAPFKDKSIGSITECSNLYNIN